MSAEFRVRHLLSSDKLEYPYWNIPGDRPSARYTLVAVDRDNKIRGLCWMAYGGRAALIILQMYCDPVATIKLYNSAVKLAKKRGCHMILSYVRKGSKILRVLPRRGWISSNYEAVLLGKPVTS